jgi:hypothetical protein
MKFIYTFDKHKHEPEKTVASYIMEKKVELGNWVNRQKKIYLDTKFWLLLRDAYLNRTKYEGQWQLLNLLTEGALSKKLICPISEDIFIEVIKQTDEVTLKATITLMDTLSAGVSLISQEERWQTEVLWFVRSCFGPKERLHDINDIVWIKLAYTGGMQIPHNKNLTDADNRLIQKSFIDQMWNLSLIDMINVIGFENLSNYPHMPDVTRLMNEIKHDYNIDNSDFRKIFLEELAFILQRYEADFDNMFAYLFEKEYGYAPQQDEINVCHSGRRFGNIIYNAFKLHKAGSRLPTFDIEAGIHAQLIFDKTRKYKANDLHDINHAIAALPYCDCFFTEKNLKEFIVRKNLAYDSKYRCTVACSINEALFLIKQMVV